MDPFAPRRRLGPTGADDFKRDAALSRAFPRRCRAWASRAGLGLSLVAAMAEAHGGLELAESPGKVGELGPGLRMALALPQLA